MRLPRLGDATAAGSAIQANRRQRSEGVAMVLAVVSLLAVSTVAYGGYVYDQQRRRRARHLRQDQEALQNMKRQEERQRGASYRSPEHR